ncbi:MAG: ribonuclease HII [Bacteroidales bacterium]|nr:ribonuclease HII [Bacteroidales bacterium]
MLLNIHTAGVIEAGCDEAGRGCLAGPVFAAAVILPFDFESGELNDSKKLNEKQRYRLRKLVEEESICWAVAQAGPAEIDKINVLNASFLAMQRAIEKLTTVPEALLIDGPRFTPYKAIPYHCIVKGDGKYLSIAAASILAKTYRDDFMKEAHAEFPVYGWEDNKGYPTMKHKLAIQSHGLSPLHRKSFNYHVQLKLEL